MGMSAAAALRRLISGGEGGDLFGHSNILPRTNEIGREYGVHPVQVGQWKKAIQENAKTLFEGKRGPKPAAAHREPELLYSEIGKLKMELDWLKKKSGISLP
jgi:transposase